VTIRVVIAEDEAIIRMDLRETLEEEGYEVVGETGRGDTAVELVRDLLTDALNANLAQVSVRQNEDMRTISGWAALIAAPTLLAGIWGMNFTHMPELDWWVGYPAALGTMLLASALLWRMFRKRDWL
jgi:magnesium transporter